MADWHNRKWLHMGLADVARQPDGRLARTLNRPYADCLHGWQRRLNRVTSLDSDPYDEAVNLEDVRKAARELRMRPDTDWH
jgi:hypothetical protein